MAWTKSPQSLIDLFDKSVPSSVTGLAEKCSAIRPRLPTANLFIGLHQNDFIMRLSKEDRARFQRRVWRTDLRANEGRPMREYVRLPEELLTDAGKRGRGSHNRWSTQKESSPRLRARNSIVASQERRLLGQFGTGEVQVMLNQQGGHREEVCSFALRI